MKYSVISGDIISSTSLSNTERKALETNLKALLKDLQVHFKGYGRIVKGDYLECVIKKPEEALRACLAIKSFVKAIPISVENSKSESRAKLFKEYGMRLAIGYGELERYDPKNGVIDGEAIYLSGRTINGKSTYDKERIVIKNTLFFASNDGDLNKKWTVVLELLDVLFNKATQRQCEVVYLKLLGHSESEISKKLGIDQSVVNRHSTSMGWNAIETAVTYFNESLTT